MRRALVASLLFATAASAGAGCSYRAKSRVVLASQIHDPAHTKLVNYLSAPVRPGQPSEQTPGPITRAAVADEAWIEKLDATTVCFRVVLRTASTLDSPLGDWRIEINGEEAWADPETISVRDYSFEGAREVLVADAVGANAFASLRLSQPQEQTFRVIERSARICAPKPASSELTLELVLPMDDRRGNWGETFAWQLR